MGEERGKGTAVDGGRDWKEEPTDALMSSMYIFIFHEKDK